MTDLATETLPLENPLLMLAQDAPVRIKARMTKVRFHRLLLRNSEVKMERDKHGVIIIYPPMTLKSAENEGNAFGYLWYWSTSIKLCKAYSPSSADDLQDGSTHKADGAWISKQKLDRLTPEEQESIAQIVPDFVMEVRSKTDSIMQLKKKMTEVWMANGVQLAWLIDPYSQKAWVYRAGAPVEEVSNFSGALSGEAVLPGFTLNLANLLQE